MSAYRDLGLVPCPCCYCDGNGNPDSQARGRPRAGPDECPPMGGFPGSSHGHVFDDGCCANCGNYDEGQREMYDHYDGCAYWDGQVCDCSYQSTN